jgi:Tol biopolymer transport system component
MHLSKAAPAFTRPDRERGARRLELPSPDGSVTHVAYGSGVRSKVRWFFTDGLPVILGVVVLPVVVFGLLVGYAPWRWVNRDSLHAPSPIARIAHWWSCNSGATGTPSWSPDGKRIAYAASGHCDTVIVVVDRDGSRRRALTSSFADWPAWSPNGRDILVRTNGGYGVVSAAGGRIRSVYDGSSDVGGTWSPDGTRIAFTHGFLPGPGGDYESTLYVMRLNGGTVRRVIGHSCDPGAPAWSPDGASLAVGCYGGLYVIDLTTGQRHRVVKEQFGFDPPTPSWSPDGRTLGYVDSQLGEGVYAVPADGSHAPRLLARVDSSSWADSVEWSPDGKWIAFSGSRGHHGGGIFVGRSDGRDVHRIARF